MQFDQLRLLAARSVTMGSSMLAASEHFPNDGPVSVPVADFRTLGELLRQIGEAVTALDGHLDPDGFRFWTPMPFIDRRGRELAALQQQVHALTSRLQLEALPY